MRDGWRLCRADHRDSLAAYARTAYFDTSEGHPLVTEDAYAVERFALEDETNLHLETLPALAFGWSYSRMSERWWTKASPVSLRAAMTRLHWLARLHVNARHAFGRGPRTAFLAHGVRAENPHWQAGVAVDRAIALESLLLSAEVIVNRPTSHGHSTIAEAGAGFRWQWTPRTVLDFGILRHLTGDDGAWSVTVGVSVARGLHLKPI